MILREREGERGSRLRSTGLAPDRFHPIRYKSIRDDVVMIDDVTRSEVGLGWIHSVTSYLLLKGDDWRRTLVTCDLIKSLCDEQNKAAELKRPRQFEFEFEIRNLNL